LPSSTAFPAPERHAETSSTAFPAPERHAETSSTAFPAPERHAETSSTAFPAPERHAARDGTRFGPRERRAARDSTGLGRKERYAAAAVRSSAPSTSLAEVPMNTTTTPPSLIPVDDETFDAHVRRAKGRFLLQVTATWCGPCRQMKPAIEQLARERAGSLRVGTLDVDACPNTVIALGVRGAPTLIVFEDGREIARQLGAVPPTVLRALVDRPSA
jgi:thiol-disulfide isomerase/thioredoxin